MELHLALQCGEELFGQFAERFSRETAHRGPALIAAVEAARREERARYGQTINLLEPNVKRSPGTLRDLQLLGWIGHARYGTAELAGLAARGALDRDDAEALDEAGEYLLRVRNELHFRAGRAADVLDRAAQVDLAARFGYRSDAGILAVEHGPDGVLCFNVEPGMVLTEKMELNQRALGLESKYPVAPPSVPASVVAWLATSDEAAAHNGETFTAQRFARTQGLHPDWR